MLLQGFLDVSLLRRLDLGKWKSPQRLFFYFTVSPDLGENFLHDLCKRNLCLSELQLCFRLKVYRIDADSFAAFDQIGAVGAVGILELDTSVTPQDQKRVSPRDARAVQDHVTTLIPTD